VYKNTMIVYCQWDRAFKRDDKIPHRSPRKKIEGPIFFSFIRTGTRQAALMDMSTDDGEPPIVFHPKRLQAYSGRGQLYSWLRAHRKEVALGLARRTLTWERICSECERQGVLTRKGKRQLKQIAWRTWKVLLRDLATLGETPLGKPEKPKPPSRMPDWTPPAFQQPAQGQPGGSVVPVGANAPKQPYDPIKRTWEIECIMAERSGKPHPPPPPHLLQSPTEEGK
jgi:hypothetical protein